MHYHFVSLDSSGKPFKAHGETVRRHYTTSNCLEKIQYRGFLNLLRVNGISSGHEKVTEGNNNSI
jgi:hypothetical protein